MVKGLLSFFTLIYLFLPAFSQVDSISSPIFIDTFPAKDSIRATVKDSVFPQQKNINEVKDSLSEKKKGKPIYKINPGVDIPVVAVGAGWSIFAFTKIYG